MAVKFRNFLIFIILIAVLIAPSFVLAAWWNPFSWDWNWFKNIFTFQKIEQNQLQENQQIQENQDVCKKENEQCGYSFGKKIGDCCEGLVCTTEGDANIPDGLHSVCKKSSAITDQTLDWKDCIVSKYGYKIKYPSDWNIYKAGAPGTKIAKCSDNLEIFTFSPNIYEDPSIVRQITIDVSDQVRLAGTIYAGAKSLNEYFSKNPAILKNYPIIGDTTLNGERMVILRDGRINIFHNNIFFDIRSVNLSELQISQFLSTLKFTDSTNSIIDWKTYTNTEYGFEIKYPQSMNTPFQVHNDSSVVVGGQMNGISIQKLHKSENNFYDSKISNNSGQCIIPENNFDIKGLFSFKDEVKINNITAYHYVNYPNVAQTFCGNQSGCIYYDAYRILHNNDCYEIIYQRIDNEKVPENINQIIFTFKFINSVDEAISCDKIIGTMDKNNCYENFAITQKDISFCEKIEEWSDTYTEAARNTCYREVAVAKEDFSVCNILKNNNSKAFCYQKVAVAIGNVEACKNVQSDGGYRNGCYSEIAAIKKDIKICDNTEDQGFNDKDSCYLSVSYDSKDFSICENIKNLIYKYQCYKHIAVNIGNIDICLKIPRDYALLRDLEGLDFQDACYYDVALKTQNPIFCDKIQLEIFREDCKKLELHGIGS